MKLVPGQNITLSAQAALIRVKIPQQGYIIHAIALGSDGKAVPAAAAAYYGRTGLPGLTLAKPASAEPVVQVRPEDIPRGTERMLLCLSAWSGFISAAGKDAIEIADDEKAYTADIPFTGEYERSLILGEIYRRKGEIRFKIRMEGFKHGIESLNQTYGLGLETTPPVRLHSPQL